MLDFTKALYLGIDHSCRSLGTWTSLTTGVPAALRTPPEHRSVARTVAALTGCERGTLGRSTLHVMWDLFGAMRERNAELFVDAGIYPIARWGTERAAAQGVKVREYPHQDAEALRRMIQRRHSGNARVTIVTDGWCTRCGRFAPLPALTELAGHYGGSLIVDDTQAMGVFGQRSSGQPSPYGCGGGGSLRWFGLAAPHIVLVASLAKALGAPLAALASSESFVRRFEDESEVRVHSSPPSNVDVRAAMHALMVNRNAGDELRRTLSASVQRLRRGLARLDLAARGGQFPVQTLEHGPGLDAIEMHRRLAKAGVGTVLLRKDRFHAMQLAFLINARQRMREIDRAVSEVERCTPVCV